MREQVWLVSLLILQRFAGAAVAASEVGTHAWAEAHCWTAGFTRGQCCNAIHGPQGNPFCWDEGEHNFQSCCGGQHYRATSCSDFVTHFSFSALKSPEGALERCADSMAKTPEACNSVNTTANSCATCADVSPHLVTYIRCIRIEQQRGGRVQRPLAQKTSGDVEDGGGVDVVVGGHHFPTILRPRMPGRAFTIAAPAFDAYVGDQLVRDGHWMPQETSLLTGLLEPGSVAVDAGANIGGFAMPLSKAVGPTGEVHAFEPFRLLFQLLTANCVINGLRSCVTHNKALGSAPARKLLRMPGLNAIGNPSKMYVADSVASEMHITYDMNHQETVEVIRLDDLHLPRLDLIKIDVESMELEMLKGAHDTLKRCRPIIYVEDSEADLANMRKPTRVMKLLSDTHSYGCINLAQSGMPSMTSLLCAGQEQIEALKVRVFSMEGLG